MCQGLRMRSKKIFTVDVFCLHFLKAIAISKNGHIPIIAVGSKISIWRNLLRIKASTFEKTLIACFICVDGLTGLAEEVEAIFVPGADCTRGIRRAIGAPEMQNYVIVENNLNVDESTKSKILIDAFEDIKINTQKIGRFSARKDPSR
ncbi:adenylate isopentenyltransferase 7, mitochondrial-like [Durio zibethinus]|uniref:Adenylate isopentenyltransferase 7, mitochondrial-like n=1 Tax=Durio zibethinus TaxID=66656 RepID=A0A6P5XXM7_DURZI|nr:adenylate isopentenyltransferase 7, mitochondrial-like [Durio zibethinus]